MHDHRLLVKLRILLIKFFFVQRILHIFYIDLMRRDYMKSRGLELRQSK